METEKKMVGTVDKQKEARIKDIKAKAKDVYDISFNYHLIHAVFGSDEQLLLDRKEYKVKERTMLQEALLNAIQARDKDLQEKLKAESDALNREYLRRKYCVVVEYISMSDIYGGRVVRADDKLKISLPRKLRKGLIDSDGKLIPDPINRIKGIMAHELGHIALHADNIPPGQGGSKVLDPLDWEADVFAKELLRLYKKRDHHLDISKGLPDGSQ